MWAKVPCVENPYTIMLKGINDKIFNHKQSTFGEWNPKTNVCSTPMCTAGNLVMQGGKEGWKLKEKYGYAKAASLIHMKVHPDMPTHNFGSIEQSVAIAYIEIAAAFEQRKNKKQKFGEWLKDQLKDEAK